ncbi:hypothetical protein [Paracoccus sp. SSK6]|uniref:hypothetical protein n=1 Tax=Paracoccus sp. SSK6 TaxID=3143131 RepID=UPI00321A9B28
MARIDEVAQENRENIEAGRATNDEKAWLAAWHADLAEIEAIQSAAQEGTAA